MSFQPTPADIIVIISTVDHENAPSSSLATERRVTPSWTILQLKAKLETITGIPPGCQRLRLVVPGNEDQWIEGEERRIGEWTLLKGCEIQVRMIVEFYTLTIPLLYIRLHVEIAMCRPVPIDASI
jgi:tubulin-specific chaperone B